MTGMPPLNEDEFDLLVSYSLGPEEPLDEAIVNAFHAAQIDVFERSTQLVDWINADVFEAIRWDTDRPLFLYTRVWDHQVVISAEDVWIYTPQREFWSIHEDQIH
jgi:hypothetical protein